MDEKVINDLSVKGFGTIELGLAAVGIAAVGVRVYKMVSGTRRAVKGGSNFASDLAKGLEDLKDDPKFKKVMEHLGENGSIKATFKKEAK